MKILLNNKEVLLLKKCSVLNVLELQNLPLSGIAIAINNKVVAKALWNETILNDNDSITVITAAFGG